MFSAATTAIMTFLMAQPVLAGAIGSSKLATGAEALIKDATTWLLVVAPLVTVITVIYYFIRLAECEKIGFNNNNTIKVYNEMPAPDTTEFPFENQVLRWMACQVFVSRK